MAGNNKDKFENYGKVPPQAVDLEEVILGALLLEKDAFNRASSIISADTFYKDAHQKIYRAIETLASNYEPIDQLTVMQQLIKTNDLDNIGGPLTLANLTNKVASAAHLEHHCRIVFDKYMNREMIRIGNLIQDKGYDDSVDSADTYSFMQKQMLLLDEAIHGKSEKKTHVSDVTDRAIEELLLRTEKAKNSDMVGIPTGVDSLNRHTGGWKNKDLIVLAARPAMGKCLSIDTQIVMYDGSIKKVQDVRVGDLLMGDDNTPRTVLSLARGREMMYWVRQRGADDYRVNESHILSLKKAKSEKGYGKNKGEILDINVKEFAGKSKRFREKFFKGFKVPIELPYRDVQIEPYFLGLWLGDGSKSKQNVYNPDKEVINYLRGYAHKLGGVLNNHDKKNCPSWCITNAGLFTLMKKMNLINNKHIPVDYMQNSKEMRLQLLAGLIDSDGYKNNENGVCEIIQKNEDLIRQFKRLCDSLGFRTTLTKCTKGIKSSGFKGEYWRLYISGDLSIIPMKVERKKFSKWTAPKDWTLSTIKVEKDCVDDYYGFTLDGNHRFLLGDNTVTHNTAVAIHHIKAAANHGVPVSVHTLEMDDVRLVDRMIIGLSGVNSWQYRNGKLSNRDLEKVNEAAKELKSIPNLHIDDTPGCSLAQIRSKAILRKSKEGLGLLVIDYLQLMDTDEGGSSQVREREIAIISRGLKVLAKELDIPIILLAQLNRAVENRPNKRPILADLRESGAIEQDADMVIFLSRPEYYDILEDEEGNSTKGVMTYDYAKFREGETGPISIRYNESLTDFYDHEDEIDNDSSIPDIEVPEEYDPDKAIDSVRNDYSEGLDDRNFEEDDSLF